MAHGAPDDSNVVKTGIVHRIDDLAELAARLGSPNVWDRRGDLLYATDFREGIGMFHSGFTGTDGGIALVTGHSRQGAYSMRLRASDEAQQYAYLQLAFPFQDPSKVGLEFSFSVAAQTKHVGAWIAWRDGAKEYIARILYHHTDSKVWYYTEPTTWTALQTGIELHECTRPEHTLKLVVDMDAEEYVRLLLDAETYSMAGLVPDEAPNTNPPYWYFYIQHFGEEDQNPLVYIDNVIVTQNEP